MNIEKRMVPEYGVTLDGVWIPYEMLEELAKQEPFASDFGNYLTCQIDRDQGRVLEAHGLAVSETRGGYHRGEKLREFIASVEWPDRGTAVVPDDPDHLTRHAVAKLLMAAGDKGMTTTDVALLFNRPSDYQHRSNHVSQIMRRFESQGYARAGENERSVLYFGTPVRRWYATDLIEVYVAYGSRADRALLRDRQAASLKARRDAIMSRQAEALRQAGDEVAELMASGKLTSCRRREIVIRLRKVPCTLFDIGKVFGLTRERIRQIEAGISDACSCSNCKKS